MCNSSSHEESQNSKREYVFRSNFVGLTLVDLPGLYYGDGMNEAIER